MAYSTETGNKNIDIFIKQLGLKQHGGGSIIFENDELFVLSPSVQNQFNRFDLNLSNVTTARLNNKKGLFIVRYLDDLLVGDLEEFLNKMVIDSLMYTNNSTQKWQYNVRNQNNRYYITLQKAKGLEFNLVKMSERKLIEYVGVGRENSKLVDNSYLVHSKIMATELIELIESYISSQGCLLQNRSADMCKEFVQV
ncbi:hypothetical protein UACE39S_00113 [Ureibacillus acetophenoni]